jgi:hypothetical protein
MKVKVYVIQFEPPRWVRRLALLGLPIAVLGIATVVLATPPHTFQTGEVLKATDLNSINILRSGGKSYSVGTTKYCGVTPLTNGQITGGYAGAKGLCEAVAACGSSPTAHMCTADELVRSAQLGVAIASGWYSSGRMSFDPTFTGGMYDCLGWTTTDPKGLGSFWQGNPPVPSDQPCDAPHPVLCCD